MRLQTVNAVAYNFGFGKTSLPVTPLFIQSPRAANLPALRILEAETGRRIMGALSKWSHHSFNISANVALPLKGQALWRNNALTLTIDNQTTLRFQDCQVYWREQSLPISALEPRRAITLELKFKAHEPLNDQSPSESLKLIGRSAAPLLAPDFIGAPVTGSGMTRLIWEIPIENL
jgi:hypothetical protein